MGGRGLSHVFSAAHFEIRSERDNVSAYARTYHRVTLRRELACSFFLALAGWADKIYCRLDTREAAQVPYALVYYDDYRVYSLILQLVILCGLATIRLQYTLKF